MQRTSWLSVALYTLTTLIGITAFIYPFFLPSLTQLTGFAAAAHAADAPLLLGGITVLCVGVVIAEGQGVSTNARFTALLAVLVAINSTLRFIEVALPGPGGFTPIFFLITLGGYVFGGSFGFLLGALTLLVSAFITGGVGPWLPYQMLSAGWVGLSAPLCHPLVRLFRVGERGERLILLVFAAAWGFLYGAIMNVWFWPYATGDASMYWQPGVDWLNTLARYGVFYLATSAAWDLFAAIGNVLLMALFGTAVLRLFRRFEQRFTVVIPGNYAAPAPASLAPLNRATGATAPPSREAHWLHPGAWAAWTAALLFWLTLTRNPFYLLLLGLVLVIIHLLVPARPAAPYALPLRLLPLALFILPFAALSNALMTHFGSTVLFTLPRDWWLIGGIVTLEALTFGLLTGFALLLMVATFVLLNRVMSISAWLELLPRAFRPVGVILIIALAFIPMVQRRAHHIREAQAIRGHQFRSWRDSLPLILPLLTSALEHAIQLAEAMTARGYGAQSAPLPATVRGGFLAGLIALLGGWWWLLLGGETLAQGVIAAGALLIGGLLYYLGRLQIYSPYRQPRWTWRDGVVVAGAVLASLVLVVREPSLFYYPYPQLTLPLLNILSLSSLLLLLSPLLPLLRKPAAAPIITPTIAEP